MDLLSIRSMRGLLSAGSCWAAFAVVDAASAQTASPAPPPDEEENALNSEGVIIEDIVVTARKREERLQDVPISLSAVGAQELERFGVEGTDELLQRIPNATAGGGLGGGLQGLVSIRGISTLVRFVGLETGVGFYLDGVYAGRPENFNQELIGIERVEVLRGPQGAIFGKNTVAGAINIITQEPGDELDATVEAQYGNFNLARVRGRVSGPLVKDVLSASVSAGYVRRDGFVENISGISPDLDTLDMFSARGKMKFTPNDAMTFLVTADGLVDRGEPAFFEVSDVAFVEDPSEETPFTVNQDQPNFLDRDIYGVSLQSDIDLFGGTWTSIFGYRNTSFDAGLDDDKVPFRFFVDFFSSDTEFYSIESRYAGSIGDRFNYLGGIYYFDQNADNVSNFALGDFLTGVPGVEPPIDLTSSVDTRSIAFFFNTDFAVTSKLTLEVGGRYVRETKDATHLQEDQTGLFGSTDFAAERTDDDFSPTVSLSYAVRDNITTYLRYAQGFKSAGFNTDFVVEGASNLEVEPEDATSYEAGLKSSFLQNRLTLNLAGFFTNYENLQLSQIVGGGVTLTNAAEAEIYGVEAEFLASPHRYLTLSGSLGYLNATYEDFTGCPVPGANTETVSDDCSGNFLNIAPEWTAALGGEFAYPMPAQLDFLGEFVARADWNYRSEVFFEPQNTERLSGDARHLVNLRAGFVTPCWEVFGWVENLTDEVYVQFADDRSAIAVNTTQAFGAPRTFGATVRFRY